jgi:hypothetical protein
LKLSERVAKVKAKKAAKTAVEEDPMEESLDDDEHEEVFTLGRMGTCWNSALLPIR